MSSTSRRISERSKHHRASHTPGREKGGFCVRPRDFGVAVNGNPFKGAGIKGRQREVYTRLWARYKSANGNKN